MVFVVESFGLGGAGGRGKGGFKEGKGGWERDMYKAISKMREFLRRGNCEVCV